VVVGLGGAGDRGLLRQGLVGSSDGGGVARQRAAGRQPKSRATMGAPSPGRESRVGGRGVGGEGFRESRRPSGPQSHLGVFQRPTARPAESSRSFQGPTARPAKSSRSLQGPTARPAVGVEKTSSPLCAARGRHRRNLQHPLRDPQSGVGNTSSALCAARGW
jgi:hypothetical protein